MNRQSGVKMFLSVITAPLVLALLIDLLIRRCHVNTYSRYKHVRANILALWMFISWIGKAGRRCEMAKNIEAAKGYIIFTSPVGGVKFASLPLFVKTSPIN